MAAVRWALSRYHQRAWVMIAIFVLVTALRQKFSARKMLRRGVKARCTRVPRIHKQRPERLLVEPLFPGLG